ncbi:MAG: N-acetylmuramoyl-L-alanine amidase [Clostridia bacterium]|nr:N-acetylmuramoyl-L-alanine amidase [Clostridia bacterium]
MWNIIKKHISVNHAKNDVKPKYVVVHDTGNSSKSADAMAHWRYFCDKTAKASYNYIADEKVILECVPPPNAAWHAGVGKSGIRKDGKKSDITNYNSIGVSYCINKGADIKKAVRNCAIAAAHACIMYDIPIENVVRHYDVTEKLCPGTMYRNEIGLGENAVPWADFEAFKVMVGNFIVSMKEAQRLCEALESKGMINNKEYWLNGLAGIDEIDVKWMRIMLDRILAE